MNRKWERFVLAAVEELNFVLSKCNATSTKLKSSYNRNSKWKKQEEDE